MRRDSLSTFAAKLSPRRLRLVAVLAAVLLIAGMASAIAPGGAGATTTPTVTAP